MIKRRKNRDIVFIILSISAILLIAGCSSVGEDVTADRFRDLPPSLAGTGNPTQSTGTTGTGDVQIDLTPHDFNNGILEVDMAVNTHSVDLSQFDLKEITTLTIDGQEFKPTEAPSLSGHHSGGTLVFNPQKEADSFTITITGIPQPQSRKFSWGG